MVEMRYTLQRWVGISTLFATLIIGGCASSKAPLEEINGVERAISTAKSHDADVYAPLDFRNAQTNLEKAKKAILDKEHEEAKRLATRAMAEAETAKEKALAEKTQKLLDKMRENVDALRHEVNRIQQ